MAIALQKIRRKRGWTQGELSKRSTVPQPMICEIENGVTKNPGILTMHRLAKALRCTVDDLIEEDDDAEN